LNALTGGLGYSWVGQDSSVHRSHIIPTCSTAVYRTTLPPHRSHSLHPIIIYTTLTLLIPSFPIPLRNPNLTPILHIHCHHPLRHPLLPSYFFPEPTSHTIQTVTSRIRSLGAPCDSPGLFCFTFAPSLISHHLYAIQTANLQKSQFHTQDETRAGPSAPAILSIP
jgi:hypothetical protein